MKDERRPGQGAASSGDDQGEAYIVDIRDGLLRRLDDALEGLA